MAGTTPRSSYPYSPTHSTNRSPYLPQDYNNASTQNYQHPPQQYPPHSPRRPLTLGSPLPAPNNLSQPAGGPPPYQPLTSSPTYSIQRPYQAPVASSSMPLQYDTTTPNHAHPPSGHATILNSPIREHRPIVNGTPRDSSAGEIRLQSSEVGGEKLCQVQVIANLFCRKAIVQATQCPLQVFLAHPTMNHLPNRRRPNFPSRLHLSLSSQRRQHLLLYLCLR